MTTNAGDAMRASAIMVAAAIVVGGLALSPSVAARQPPASGDAPKVDSIERAMDALRAAMRAGTAKLDRDTLLQGLAARAAVRSAAQAVIDAMVEAASASTLLAYDYVGFEFDTAPRLSGRILRVGPGEAIEKFNEVWASLKPGDTVLFAAGRFEITDRVIQTTLRSGRSPLTDVQFVGAGVDQTTITGDSGLTFRGLQRVRFADMIIDAMNSPVIDLSGGQCQFRDCRIVSYNSGAGGSNAISASRGSVLLLERCTFDGRDGRAEGRNYGVAFDLRGEYAMYARGCEFIDNEEISRATDIEVYDACVSSTVSDHDAGINLYSGGTLLLRDNHARVRGNKFSGEFTFATDDRAMIDAALGRPSQLDALGEQVVRELALSRRLPYWIGLLRSADPQVRRDASAQLRRLTDQDVPEQPGSIAPGIGAADIEAAMAAEQVYARLAQWFEEVRDRLVWNEADGRWEIAPPDDPP